MDTRVKISKEQFDSLGGKDLEWDLIMPTIQQVRGQNLQIKKEVYEKLTPGQKSLFSFWILLGHTQSGWLQFFLEGYAPYLPLIKRGLEKIGDQAMLANLHDAETLYIEISDLLNLAQALTHGVGIIEQVRHTDWEVLQHKFVPLDHSLWTLLDESFQILERYIRNHPDEFVVFTD
jgi:hypothetical protein